MTYDATPAFAAAQDAADPLARFRTEFSFPKGPDGQAVAYFCGNSLGLQPRRTKDYVNRYLDTWASKGVFGHFTEYHGGLPPWLHIDDAVKHQSAKLVGALPTEVCVMETLTANLHLLMASFYRPTTDR